MHELLPWQQERSKLKSPYGADRITNRALKWAEKNFYLLFLFPPLLTFPRPISNFSIEREWQ